MSDKGSELTPPSVTAQMCIAFLLTRIGSWTPARWDQHLRHEIGDAADEAIRWIDQTFGVTAFGSEPASKPWPPRVDEPGPGGGSPIPFVRRGNECRMCATTELACANCMQNNIAYFKAEAEEAKARVAELERQLTMLASSVTEAVAAAVIRRRQS